MQVYCAEAQKIPATLKEIGRLREVAFREVGEGSGKSSDIDQYDDYYLHFVLWNKKTTEVVGAYRIGKSIKSSDTWFARHVYAQPVSLSR